MLVHKRGGVQPVTLLVQESRKLFVNKNVDPGLILSVDYFCYDAEEGGEDAGLNFTFYDGKYT